MTGISLKDKGPDPAHPRFIHGQCGNRTYVAWQSLICRCTNPRQKAWANYGGRGIKVCDRWRTSFLAFLEDMGERPEGMSIDRIDVNGDYTPENCRWATAKEQMRNMRRNNLVTHDGQTRTVAEWAEILGVDPVSLNKRLRRGWPVHLALTTPFLPDHAKRKVTNGFRQIIDCLWSGPKRVTVIVKATGRTRSAIDCTLYTMYKAGYVERVATGVYGITEAGQRLMPLTRER
jgi:hypothetical protein